MRCLIDANILLDVLCERKPFVSDSAKIWKLCETGSLEGFISALTFADLVYILRKELDPQAVRKVLDALKMIFRITDLKEIDLINAAALNWRDYEDAVQAVSAERISADFIVTRNTRDYTGSAIKAVLPEEVLSFFS